jgi:D-glycero-alpha-D-manno-heptose 1-phosphate guanylyltransferase
MMNTKEAIVLAGGLGTRLRSAVPDLPKCMATVAGKPFLYYVIGYFQHQGIEKFILSLGYKHEIIEEYIHTEFRTGDFKFVVEDEPLGTGGAIRLACKQATEKTALILNGDTFFRIRLEKLSAFHHMCGADCTLSLKPMKNFERYGVVELSKDYSIKSFHEKKYYEEGLINGGVYALNTGKFMQEALPEKFSFEKDYLETLYPQRRMFGVVQDEYFIDIGIPGDYQKAQAEFTNLKI